VKYLDIGGIAHKKDDDGRLWRLSSTIDWEATHRRTKRESEQAKRAEEECQEKLEEYNKLSFWGKWSKSKPILSMTMSWLQMPVRKEIWEQVTEEDKK